MNNVILLQQLHKVGGRYRQLWRSIGLLICWSILAIIGIASFIIARAQNQTVSSWLILALIVLAVLAIPVVSLFLIRSKSPIWVAHLLEKRFPDLNSRLLAAMEQKPDPKSQELGYLQQIVVGEAIEHGRIKRWESVVSSSAFHAANWGKRLAMVALTIVIGTLLLTKITRLGAGANIEVATDTSINVEPGDTTVERGTGMLVLARFTGQLPGQVQLLARSSDGKIDQLAMTKSLDDPIFAARVPSVNQDMQYAVRYGNSETKWFSAKVFEYPDLKQADANLKFPSYTNLPEKKVEDVRSITAVEGSTVKLELRLNKPVTEAVLTPTPRPSKPGETVVPSAPIKLMPDANDPNLYTTSIDMKQSQLLRLRLIDAEGRENKQPASELTLNVNPNRPPEMKPVTPGRDVDVSPIQELSTGVKVSDDFGVSRVGITYSMAGQAPQDVVLASAVPANEKKDVSHLLSFEQLKAQPDQLLSYYFWAEDYAADGSIRRTSGDMYFAEVRPFEQIFRQGQQTSQSEQQQQQQSQQGNQQNAQQAEELAEMQKQIIAATWKIIRRETASAPSSAFGADVGLVSESQTSARQRASAMEERLTDAKSQAFLRNVLNYMDQAAASLNSASSTKSIPPLTQALSSEQAAYQELLKLRAREFEVIRGNRQQNQQGQQSSSSASSRRQQQLDQLQLDQEQNRYETQREASPQQDNPQQRETRQVLNRLKELAQRQEDLNRQMREIQNTLEQSRDQQQREELQRQLARLRDQQQQQLRDTDELRDRMDQPQNQERMAEARQQLEQTREDVRRASEALSQEQVPEAASAGARASEQLNNLSDQVRRDASSQFAEAMNNLRQDARQLDENQQKISEQLKQLDSTEQRSLRESTDRQQVTRELAEQKQELEKLLDSMRKTVDESETTEPLLSKQLYETLRQTGQAKTDQALDVSKQLLDRGFTPEARQVETEAAKGISRLREGVEQAANGVLGDEADALRRARSELDRLSQELEQEVNRNRPARQANASPATRPSGQLAGVREPSTRPASQRNGNSNSRNPTTQNSQQAADGQQSGQQNQQDQQAANQQNSDQANGQSPRDGQQQQNRQNGNAPQQSNQSQQANAGSQRQEQNGENPDQQSESQVQGQRQAGDQQQDQPGQSNQQASAEQPGNSEQQATGQNPGQQGQGRNPGLRNPNAQPGEQNQQNQENDQNPELAQADQQQPGQRRPGNQQRQQGAGQGQQQGQNQQDQQQNQNQDNPRNRGNGGNVNLTTSDPNNPQTGIWRENDFGAGDRTGPLTGENFRDWSDRLRDVEEMVSDPQLRNRAARIRERARELRGESRRHSVQPNWDVVEKEIGMPLAELRNAVSEELMRRDSPEALVPLDREAVPPQFAEQVRQYYERLGGSR